MNAVDSNILVYFVDKKELVKQPKAERLIRQLVAGGGTVMLWQVLVESIHQLRRWKDRGDLTVAEFDQHAQEFRSVFPVVFPTIDVLDHALDLTKRYSLSHWDSMILGACKVAGVTTLYTEDMGSPRLIDGIQLINPLI
jgi:predicted nucleic acid-binding protein